MSTTGSTTKRVAEVRDDYLDLIRRFPLRPIRTKAEHAAAIAVLLPLAGKATVVPRALTSGEEDYYLVLGRLIYEYETPVREAMIAGSTPLSRLRFLMEESGLKSKDLAALIGSRSGASMILNGKRPISRGQAKAIAARFGVNAGMFL
jgi:HTH-type transcriptional regulator/antitoxin HigA